MEQDIVKNEKYLGYFPEIFKNKISEKQDMGDERMKTLGQEEEKLKKELYSLKELEVSSQFSLSNVNVENFKAKKLR